MISLSQPANLILTFHDLQVAVTRLFVKMMNSIDSKVYKHRQTSITIVSKLPKGNH